MQQAFRRSSIAENYARGAFGAEGAPAHRRTLSWRAARMRNVQDSGENVPIITARATLGRAAPNAQLLGTGGRNPRRHPFDRSSGK
jgi:hypothetical protein